MLILKIIATILLAGLAGYFNYLGGEGQKLWKRLGVPAAATLLILIYGLVRADDLWWVLLIHFGALAGTIGSYHKWLNKYFGDTTEDAHFYNWFANGAFCALAALPVAYASGHWLWF